MDAREAGIEMMTMVELAGAGTALVCIRDGDGSPLGFAYACVEPELARRLVPMIEEMEAKYDEESVEEGDPI